MTGAEIGADDRRWRRGDLFAVLGAVALGAVLAVILMSIMALRNDLQVANEARDALASQVQGLGATPVAGEPGSRGDIGPSGPSGPPGPTGPPGEPGSPGPSGPPGRQGAGGTPGAVGSPGPTGAAGVSGNDGAPGADGKDGVNGQDGAPGKDGKDGVDGQDGADGKPPAGWTYVDDKGRTYTCRPVEGTDPNNPYYTCTADEEPEPGQTLLGMAVLSSAAMYRKLV